VTDAGDRDDRTLTVVAYHEAGHAAAHVALDVPIRSATIVPDGGTRGSVVGVPLPKYVLDWFAEGGLSFYVPVPLRVRDRLERQIMILFAGELAQERETGTTEGSAVTLEHPEHGIVIVDGDEHVILDLVDRLSYGDDDRSAYYAWLRARTAVLLSVDEVWAMVDAIAAGLIEHKKLSGRQVRHHLHEVSLGVDLARERLGPLRAARVLPPPSPPHAVRTLVDRGHQPAASISFLHLALMRPPAFPVVALGLPTSKPMRSALSSQARICALVQSCSSARSLTGESGWRSRAST